MIYHNGTSNFTGLEQDVRRCTKALLEHADEFDCIVVRGLSGLSVGFPASLQVKKPIIAIRKPGDDSHGRPIVGAEYIQRFGPRCVMLDDFVVSGRTTNVVKEAVEMIGGQLVAMFVYAGKPNWKQFETS